MEAIPSHCTLQPPVLELTGPHPDGALQPAYAGVRARIFAPTQAAADFRIDDAHTHGVPPVVNLFGIESPGLTASLAIASEVAARS